MDNIPYINVKQMTEIDRIMIQDYSIYLLQMMENAGRLLAKVALQEYNPQKVCILVGKGNNGGGGLVSARYLHNKGVKVEIILASEDVGEIPSHHIKTLKAMGINFVKDIDSQIDLIIDALLGYNAIGEPKGRIGELVGVASLLDIPILSLDVPTGFDLVKGVFHKNSFASATTLTLGLPKDSMQGNIAGLFLGDIGIPREVYQEIGIDAPNIFKEDDIVKIT